MSNAQPTLEEAMAFAGQLTEKYQSLTARYVRLGHQHIAFLQRLEAWWAQIFDHIQPKCRSRDPADHREAEAVMQILETLRQMVEEEKQRLPVEDESE